MGWTLHMVMCVLLCYPVSFHMLQLLLTGRPISSLLLHLAQHALVLGPSRAVISYPSLPAQVCFRDSKLG